MKKKSRVEGRAGPAEGTAIGRGLEALGEGC